MIELHLTHGYIALIDDKDAEQAQYKWHSHVCKNTVYARRSILVATNKQKEIRLHRVLLGLTDPRSFGEHIDGNGLNNRRYNLRVATNLENQCNRGPQRNNKGAYKGVCWKKEQGAWVAQITTHGEVKHLGYFNSPELAALAYNAAALTFHGEFANLNQVNSL